MARLIVLVTLLTTSCGSPTWPEERFPPTVEVERVLFANQQMGFREGCVAIVVELTDNSATQLLRLEQQGGELVVIPPEGWTASPITNDGNRRNFYEPAFNGCDDEGNKPLGDLSGALAKPGAFYKIINGREGIAIIVPRAKLAGFFYSG